MWRWLTQYGLPFLLALIFHVLVIAGLFFSFTSKPLQTRTPGVKKQNVIQAVAVNETAIQSELDKLRRAEKRKKQRQAARLKQQKDQVAKARADRIKEQKKLKALKQQQLKAAEKLKNQKQAIIQQNKAARKKISDLKKKQQQEALRIQKLEKAAQDLKNKKLAEQKKLAALEREKQKKAAEDQRLKELKARMAAEERAELDKELKGHRMRYIDLIAAVVKRNWRRPEKVGNEVSCQVYVNQIPGGEIISYRVTRCTGSKAFRHSVVTALGKTSHLPPPSDPRVFDRDIRFTFKPQ